MMQDIISMFTLEGKAVRCIPYGSGHINQTWLVETDKPHRYILQKVNTGVFPNGAGLMNNIILVTEHLRKKDPDPRHVLTLVPAKKAKAEEGAADVADAAEAAADRAEAAVGAGVSVGAAVTGASVGRWTTSRFSRSISNSRLTATAITSRKTIRNTYMAAMMYTRALSSKLIAVTAISSRERDEILSYQRI